MPASTRRQVDDSEVNWKKIALIGAATFIVSLIIGRWFGGKLLESRNALKTPPGISNYSTLPEQQQATENNASPPRQNIASSPLVVPPPVVEPNTNASASTSTAPDQSSAPASSNNEDETTAAPPAPAVAEKPKSHSSAPFKGTNGFRVQAGLFANEDNAKDLVSHLRGEGYHSDFEMISRPNGNFYRVWVGPFDSRDEAESTAGELNGAGYQSFVLSTR